MKLLKKPSILNPKNIYARRDHKSLTKVEIYTSTFCGYCRAAKSLLIKKGVEYVEVDLSSDPQLRVEIVEKHKWRTVPIIIINDELIGGYFELVDLEKKGILDGLLAKDAKE